MTYGEAGTARKAVGSGLQFNGLQKVSNFYLLKIQQLLLSDVIVLRLQNLITLSSVILQGDCVGIYFINRPEWLIVDHACAAFSYISVPLYDTLGVYLI